MSVVLQIFHPIQLYETSCGYCTFEATGTLQEQEQTAQGAEKTTEDDAKGECGCYCFAVCLTRVGFGSYEVQSASELVSDWSDAQVTKQRSFVSVISQPAILR